MRSGVRRMAKATTHAGPKIRKYRVSRSRQFRVERTHDGNGGYD